MAFLLSLLFASELVTAEEEERKRTGADVRAGDRFVADQHDFMRRIVAVEQFYQLLGVLGAVRVGDADSLIVRLAHQLVVLLCQRLDGVLSAAGLFKADDLALGVTFKNRLYYD